MRKVGSDGGAYSVKDWVASSGDLPGSNASRT